ncbi:hypothetical protein FRC03_000940 [Tulasnella sp. 419]|nr:hypothetical protein FRC03_000940 [Tulasnella sp. 419]
MGKIEGLRKSSDELLTRMAAALPSPNSVVIAKLEETASAVQSEEIRDLSRLLSGNVDQNKMLVEEAKQLREDLEEEFCVGAGDCKIRSVAFATLLQRMTGWLRRLTIEVLKRDSLVLGDEMDGYLRLFHAIHEEDLKYKTLLCAITECDGLAKRVQFLLDECIIPTEGLFAGLEMVYEDNDEEEERKNFKENFAI